MTRWSTPPPRPAALTQGLALAVADKFLAGRWHEEALVRRGGILLGHRPRWLRAAARAILAEYPGPDLPAAETVAVAILGQVEFQRAVHQRGYLAAIRVRLARWFRNWRGRTWRWEVPRLRSVGEVAQWLGLPPGQMDWLADADYWERRTGEPRLCNYHYRWVKKRRAGYRLLEVPKPRLKALQRRVLDEIVARIPPHQAAHGFRRGRSVQSFVAPHAGQAVVLRMDLADFFPSIGGFWVRAVFRTAGYDERVARLLAGLCTNAAGPEQWPDLPDTVPRRQADQWRRMYRQPHLPQGAPTSPALANLCAWGLDVRLTALATAVGARYTRYADDLLFSGPAELGRMARRLVTSIAAVALEEGFGVAFHKTRVMRRGVRQHAGGLVLNVHPQVPRAEFDRLKATLTNCLRHGATSQNRQQLPEFAMHLAGRISYLAQFNAARGERLWALWRRVRW